jgi:hypothetical protein
MESHAVHSFDAANYVATDCLPRDREQSHRLHEPERLVTNIDPITGRDITDLDKHPRLVDGNVTMYFESEETKQAYLDMPIDHPLPLADNPFEEGEAEG